MLRILSLSLLLSAAAAYAQDDITGRHQNLCEQDASCRLNIIPQKVDKIQGVCRGTLLDERSCQFNFQKNSEVSQIKILCPHEDKTQEIQALFSMSFIAYKVSTITKDASGYARLKVDPKLHVVFDHPAIKMWLEKQSDLMDANIHLIMSETRPVTNVICEEITSESGSSSDVQPQSENPF